MVSKIKYIFLFILVLESCESQLTNCNIGEQRVKNWCGRVRIDSIYLDWRNHAHAAIDTEGNKVLFSGGDMLVEPKKGDSLIKDTGTVEYTLIRGDSMYIQKWDCLHLKQVVVATKLLPRSVK